MGFVLFFFRLAVESCVFRRKAQGMRGIPGYPVVDFEPERNRLTYGFKEQCTVILDLPHIAVCIQN